MPPPSENIHRLNRVVVIVLFCFLTKKKLFQGLHSAFLAVNSEIFARVLISPRNLYAKFRENKTRAKWLNHSVVYCFSESSCPVREILTSQMSFNAFRENKILAKTSEFTVVNDLVRNTL